jgi:RNA polymerase sigma factor (sigma-70 family)
MNMIKNGPPNSSDVDSSGALENAPVSDAFREHVAQLFMDCGDILLRYLKARLPAEEAKEVVQDAYERMLRLEEPDQVECSAKYVFRIAVNLANNRLKQRKVHQRAHERMPRESEHHSSTPESICAASEQAVLLGQAIEHLPASQRKAFTLVRYHGMSVIEAANHLGLNPRKVRRDVDKAVEYLEEVLTVNAIGQGRHK